MRLVIRTLWSARKFVLAVSRQPENAVASSAPTSALPPPRCRYPASGISGLNGISVSVRASALPPLHARHPPTSMQHGIWLSVQASPRSPDRHLPAWVLLTATPPVLLPVLWTCDRTRTP